MNNETPDWKIVKALGFVLLMLNVTAGCMLFWIWAYQAAGLK